MFSIEYDLYLDAVQWDNPKYDNKFIERSLHSVHATKDGLGAANELAKLMEEDHMRGKECRVFMVKKWYPNGSARVIFAGNRGKTIHNSMTEKVLTDPLS